MPAEKAAKKAAKPWLPILLCWMAYTSAYLGRYSYSSSITAVMAQYRVSHADAGLVTTCFFFAYGAGQVVNGLLCKRYSWKWSIAAALTVSSLLNLAVFLGVPFPYLKYLWVANGMAQSILWPTLIYILSRSLPGDLLKRSVIVMSSTVPIGTVTIYSVSALMTLVGNFRFSFLFGAAVMAAAAAVWLVSCKRIIPAANKGSDESERAKIPDRKGISRAVLSTVIVLGLFAVVNNLVKDGLTTWVPSILKERFGLPDSLSILLTLTLPIVGLFGAASNTVLQKRVSSFISLSGIWYLIAAVCIGVVILFVGSELWGVMLLSFGVVSLAMYGVNNVITSMAPLYMREQANSGLLAGLLNGCCYVGSTISSYGLGSVADRFGWNGVFLLLLAVSCLPVLIAAGWKFLRKNT